MKGLLKIYHPDETLKYNIRSSYCKAVYTNAEHFLEVEIHTDDSLDKVEDDSLHNNFPQLSLYITDFPLQSEVLLDQTFLLEDPDTYTEVDLHDDEEAFLYENELCFTQNEFGEMQLTWKGKIDNFYTNTDVPIPFKLKCHFKEEEILIEED